jgi:DnaK suppressor protein
VVPVLFSPIMEQQEIKWFRARLQEQRERVAAEVSAHASFPGLEAGDNGSDLEEQATRAADDFVEAKVTEDRGKLLRKIDLALERLDAGTYQECAHCGKTIPLERLRAKPSVSLCLDCQQAKDAGMLAGA